MPRRVSLVLAIVALASCAPAYTRMRSTSLEGYRVVYRVEERSPGRVEVRTEVREVHRPFAGRVEVRDGPPPGGEVRTGSVVNRSYQWALGSDGERVGFRRPPGGPVADASYDALRDAVRARLAIGLGLGTAHGRRCTWFAYAEPTGPLARPTEESRVESCVDATGILLRQAWTIEGKVARVVEATSVTTEPPRPERFLTDRKPKEDEEGIDPETLIRSAVVVDDDADEGNLAVRLDAPEEYKVRRDAVVAESGGEGQPPSQTFAQAYVRGSEIVVVERSTNPQLRPVWSPSEGTRVSLGPLGEGRLVYFVDRVEIRLVGTRGYARIRAPSRSGALLFARRLRDA